MKVSIIIIIIIIFCKRDWTNPELFTFWSFIFEGGKGWLTTMPFLESGSQD